MAEGRPPKPSYVYSGPDEVECERPAALRKRDVKGQRKKKRALELTSDDKEAIHAGLK